MDGEVLMESTTSNDCRIAGERIWDDAVAVIN